MKELSEQKEISKNFRKVIKGGRTGGTVELVKDGDEELLSVALIVSRQVVLRLPQHVHLQGAAIRLIDMLRFYRENIRTRFAGLKGSLACENMAI